MHNIRDDYHIGHMRGRSLAYSSPLSLCEGVYEYKRVPERGEMDTFIKTFSIFVYFDDIYSLIRIFAIFIPDTVFLGNSDYAQILE